MLAPSLIQKLIRPLAAVAVAGPCALLAISFAVVCAHWGTLAPWNLAVHEDGERTLLNTIFFFEHATREMPGDLLLAMAAGAAVYFALPQPKDARPRFDGRDRFTTAVAVVIAAIIVGMATVQGGGRMVVENLLQHHTRPGAPLIWGSHWRYHLLERLPMILTATGLGAGIRLLIRGNEDPAGKAGGRAGIALIGLYLVATVVFTRSWSDLALPLFDARYLGHEAREIATHLIMTLPLALGGAVLLQGPFRETAGIVRTRPTDWAWPIALLTVAFVMASYALVAAMASGAASEGQTDDIVSLVFVHFFEHDLGYTLVPFVAASAYGVCRALDRR